MKTMQKWLALALALVLLLTFTACGKDSDKKKNSTKTTAPRATQSGTAATTPTEGATTVPTTTTTDGGLLPDDEPNGSKELPFEIGGTLAFDAVVKAGGVTYYDVYRVSGTDLRIEHKDAYVEYEGKTYEPKNGVITFPVVTDDILNPVKLAIGNKGTADATFQVTFAYPAGTKNNPIELKEGELVTMLQAGDEDGLIYLFTATEAGTLTVMDNSVTKGQGYDISLFNLTNSAIRTLAEDGVEKEGKKMVSVSVSKGDKVEVTLAALPNDKNEYPAVTLKTLVAFTKKGAADTEDDQPKDATYTVTVKDKTGAAMAGVSLQFDIGGKKATASTNDKGVATAVMPKAEGTVTITVPKGYIAEKFTYGISSAAPTLAIVLEKEAAPEEPEQPEQPEDPEEPEVTTMDYTVTVVDGKGAPVGGVTVGFYAGDKQVAQKVADKKGVVTVTLDRGTYTVQVSGTDLHYDDKAAAVSVNKPALTLVAAPDIDTAKSLKINDPLTDKLVKTYYLPEGAVYVPLTAGERNYFLFEPTRDGTFRFSSSNTYAKIGFFGTDMYVYTTDVAEDLSGNAFNISVNEGQIGNIFVIGIDAATNCSAAVLQVTRIGDPAWSIQDEPTIEYKGNGAPVQITAPSGLTDVDIRSSAEFHLVYNEKDGYYHLDSATGPVVYVRLNKSNASIVGLLTEFGNMTAYLYNTDGTFKSKEQYAPLMQQYVNKMDKTQQVYPLTKDLKYMIENYGNSQNWWNAGEPGYLFEEVDGVNPANAALFLYCYKK